MALPSTPYENDKLDQGTDLASEARPQLYNNTLRDQQILDHLGGSIITSQPLTPGPGLYQLGSTLASRNLQRQFFSETTALAGTALIPVDNTTPLNTEGTEFLTGTLTPQKTDTTFYLVGVNLTLGCSRAGIVTVALFVNTDTVAVTAKPGMSKAANDLVTVAFDVLVSRSGAGAVTFAVRAGLDTAGGAGTVIRNGAQLGQTGAPALYGNTIVSAIHAREIG